MVKRWPRLKQSMQRSDLPVGDAAANRHTVLTMAANEGHLPLLMNHLCALRANNITSFLSDPHVVFTSSKALQRKLATAAPTLFTWHDGKNE